MESEIIELMKILVGIPAIAPESGGQGEWEKAQALIEYLQKQGMETLDHYNAPDSRVPQGFRPNFSLILPGGPKDGPVLWIMSHLDVVPAGEASLWKGDPFALRVEGDRLIGRGVEDNHHGLVASVMAALEIQRKKLTPQYRTKLLFVSDEEIASKHGIQYVTQQPGLFNTGDMALVPDGGSPSGGEICIAEKGILWLKFKVIGRQCHASAPDDGRNAFFGASKLSLAIKEGLEKRFSGVNGLFNPRGSTFEPTRMEVPDISINTIPAEVVFYMDCRILPQVNLDAVLDWIGELADLYRKELDMDIEWSVVDRVESSVTSESCPLVRELTRALKAQGVRNIQYVGAGGGTVASGLREYSVDAVVWSTIHDKAHQIEEWTTVSNIKQDAQVMVRLICGT